MARTTASESTSEPASNALEWSVSELSGALKRTIEDQFGFVRVRGEISSYRGPAASGHAYFCLKDEGARIDAVIWRGTLARLRTKPEEGLEVIATGRVTTFPGKSAYQVIVESLEPAGIGALMALLEERRKRLAAEGLFAEERKRPLPYLPQVVGVVTSPTGAVIRDILHRLSERFPRRVIVWPVRVQGETSAAEVAAAIAGFNALPEGGPVPRPDVLIVARGGGSLEDLMGFNEEAVVRAAAASKIPLISAVGHETDWTLIDHASDLRAPTPTAAAERAVPVRAELVAAVADLDRRLALGVRRLVERRRSELRAVARALPGRDALLAAPRQRLDLAAARLPAALERGVRGRHARLVGLSQRLQQASPHVRLARLAGRVAQLGDKLHLLASSRLRAEGEALARRRERLDGLQRRALQAMAAQAERRRARLASLAQLLDSVSHTAVLRRGFVLVRDASGRPVRTASATQAGQGLSLAFADGEVAVVVEGEGKPRPEAPARKAPKPAAPGQPNLFDL